MMKQPKHGTLLLIMTLVTLARPSLQAHAQALPSSLNSSIELVRAGAQAERAAMISAGMNFTEKEGVAFWPIYRQYEYQRSRLDDRRVAVIKEYIEKYPSLTDAEAKDMVSKMLDYDAKLVALKKTYFRKFNSALPAVTVTKFFQLERRIDLMRDMRVESTLPPLAQSQSEPEN